MIRPETVIHDLMLSIAQDECDRCDREEIRRYLRTETVGWNILYNALAYLDGRTIHAKSLRFTHQLEDEPPCPYCDNAICDCV